MSKSDISREYAEKHGIPVIKLDANDVLFHGFDMDELRNVALVVIATNQYASHFTVEQMMEKIRDTAVSLKPDYPCYISTMGFNVSGYYKHGDQAQWAYRVTLTAYQLVKHLNI